MERVGIMSRADELFQIIHERKTIKVLGQADTPVVVPASVAERNDPKVRRAVEVAGMAPFHFPRMKEIAEPWRAYQVWNAETNTLAKYLAEDCGVKTKEPQLMASCSALVLVTWLPEYPQAETEKERMQEEEHIAAASAMVQNLLLMLTAEGFGNYWSSGGILRTPALFEYLGIPQEERLLGAIFIEYPECAESDAVRKPGGLRTQRGLDWVQDVSLKPS